MKFILRASLSSSYTYSRTTALSAYDLNGYNSQTV